LKPLAASSTTTVEFVWDGDLRARRGLGGCWQSRWVAPDGFAVCGFRATLASILEICKARWVDPLRRSTDHARASTGFSLPQKARGQPSRASFCLARFANSEAINSYSSTSLILIKVQICQAISQGLVCVTKRASPTLFHRQPRLGAIQRLDLAFLIDREHDGVVGRINVQANDLLELGRELRIVGQLKAAYQMRSQAMSAPDSLHRTLRSSRASGHSKCLAAPAAWDIGCNPPRGAENQSRCSRDRFVIQASMIE
jgi:hypothetical protein